MSGRARGTSVLGLIFCIVVAGCSGGTSTEALCPVQGKVLVKGKPAAYAKLTFTPVDDLEAEFSTAFGVADENGEFRVRTFKPSDGAKPGPYYVSVSWRIPGNPRSNDDPEYGNELLPRKFQDPVNSGIQVDIDPGMTELLTFDLTP